MDIGEFLTKKIKKIKKDDFIIIGFLFVLGIVNYFYFMTNNVLSADGMFNGPMFFAGNWEFDLGRPLLVLIDKIKFGLVSVPIIMFFSFIYMAISVLIIKKIFNIKKLFTMLLIALILVLFPVLSESSLCIYCFDSYMISMLTSILSIYFINKKKYVFSIILIIISLSIYQAYISITIVGVMILFIRDILKNKCDLKRLFINMLVIFIGLISYFIILKVLFLIFHRTFADYKGASSFGFLALIKNLPIGILNCYKDFYQYFITDNIIFNNYYHRNIINIMIFCLFIISIIKPFIKLNIKNKLLFILSIVILPICTNIMDLIAISTNITLMTGIGFLFIYILIIVIADEYLDIKILKNLLYILIIILSYTFLLSNNSTFMARDEIYNNFYYECNQLLYKIKNVEGYRDDLPVMINDIFKYNSSFVKSSNGFFALQNQTFENQVGLSGYSVFYKRYFGEDITMVDKNKYFEIVEKDEYKDMNINEVKIIDDVIVYKISDNILYE